MTTDTIPVSPLSIWDPVHLGTDEFGNQVEVTLAERNMLIGGEPGGGKSVALQLIVAHGALSTRLPPDPRRRQERRTRPVATLRRAIHRPVHRRRYRHAGLAPGQDRRADRLAARSRRSGRSPRTWGSRSTWSPSMRSPTTPPPPEHSVQQKEFNARNRDVVARGRAPGIIAVEATQRPSADIIPTSPARPVRLPVGIPLLHRGRSDTILGHGWASTRATPPRTSTPSLAGCPGCAPKTASPAASRPPTSPTNRSSSSPPGPPKPAPSTTASDQHDAALT